MSLYRAEGIVLRSRALGEADRLVTLLTRHEGKAAAVARGAGRARSPLLALCQPFTHGHFHLYRRSGPHSLSRGDVIEAFRPLREDVWRMALASCAAELADRALPEADPHPDVFALLLGTLHMLAWEPSPAEQEAALLKYELRLMALLGYRPRLDGCAVCGEPADGGTRGAVFDAAAGGLVCGRCASGNRGSGNGGGAGAGDGRPLGAETVAVMRHILQVGLSRLRIIKPSPRALAELRAVMDGWIERHLEGPLRSRSVLDALRGAGGGSPGHGPRGQGTGGRFGGDEP